MDSLVFHSKFNALPEEMKVQVLDFIDFLLTRNSKPAHSTYQEETWFKSGFGGAKGMFVMAEDFNEPIEDYQETL